MSIVASVVRLLCIYATVVLLGFAIYVASFHLPLGATILFYRGLLLAALTGCLTLAGLFLMSRWMRLDLATALGATFTSVAFNICFLVLFPVTIDRSISVFLLSRIAAQDGMTTDQLTARFADEYLYRMKQIPRRVDEQTKSGNIAVTPDGRITLTPQGRRFVHLAQSASGWFGTDPRFTHPTTR